MAADVDAVNAEDAGVTATIITTTEDVDADIATNAIYIIRYRGNVQQYIRKPFPPDNFR